MDQATFDARVDLAVVSLAASNLVDQIRDLPAAERRVLAGDLGELADVHVHSRPLLRSISALIVAVDDAESRVSDPKEGQG